MKVLLTGATGFIGNEVLHQCLHHPKITCVIALSRRPLPSASSENTSKLKTVIMEDFMKYPDSVLKELAGVEACIWCLGSTGVSNMEVSRRINLEYTAAGVDAVVTKLAPQLKPEKHFRFVYVSGIATEQDQSRSLWFAGEFRRMRGQVETNILSAASQHPDKLLVFVARPGYVMKKSKATMWNRPAAAVLAAVFPALEVEQLAAALVDLAVTGQGQEIWENSELKARGAELWKGIA